MSTPLVSAPRFRRELLISPKWVASTLSDFPLWVRFTHDARLGAADPADLLFVDPSSASACPHEIVTWSGGGGTPVHASLVVRVPRVRPGQWTPLWMYYGSCCDARALNPGTTSRVWSNGYRGVWHLGDGSALSLADSTEYGNPLTTVGSPLAVPSLLHGGGGGVSSNNAAWTNYLSAGQPAALDWTGAFTLSAACRFTTLNTYGAVISRNYWVSSSNNGGYSLQEIPYAASTKFRCIAQNNNDENARSVFSASTLATNTTYYVAMTYDGSAKKVYLNGSLNASASYPETAKSVAADFRICTIAGTVCEPRYANLARSADWLAFEYHNLADPDHCLVQCNDRDLTDDLVLLAPFLVARSGGGPFPHHLPPRLHGGIWR